MRVGPAPLLSPITTIMIMMIILSSRSWLSWRQWWWRRWHHHHDHDHDDYIWGWHTTKNLKTNQPFIRQVIKKSNETLKRRQTWLIMIMIMIILIIMIMYEVIKWNIDKEADLSKMCPTLSCSVERQRTIPENCLQALVSINSFSF